MALLTIGMLGLMSAEIGAKKADGQGLKVSQASEIAQRTIHSLELLDWNDVRLSDTTADNNGDIVDSAELFAKETVSTTADHQLELPGATLAYADALRPLAGFAANDTLDYNGDGTPDFDVYWNIADCALDNNWQFDCDTPAMVSVKRVGVVVRFRHSGRWLRVSSQTAIFNPSNLGE
jgi:hypothetical protein